MKNKKKAELNSDKVKDLETEKRKAKYPIFTEEEGRRMWKEGINKRKYYLDR